MNYGIGYQGSKNKIAQKIIDFLPEGDCLVDLFGGGGAISHCAILANKWNKIIYNEYNPLLYNLFIDAIEGKFSYEKGFIPEWVGRNKFHELKVSDGYIKYIWSYGCGGKDYLYSKEIEQKKKILHNIIFGLNDGKSLLLDWEGFPDNILGYKNKRLYLMAYIKKIIKEKSQRLEQLERIERLQQLEHLERIERLQQLQQLQQIERLQQLEQLERIERSKYFNLDYREYPLQKGDIVYCDPPYFNTKKYDYKFDHTIFWDWVRNCGNKVFVSEYNAPSDFKPIYTIEKISLFDSGTRTKKKENIYCNFIDT